MKSLGLRFLLAIIVGVSLGSFASNLFAQFAPPTGNPATGEVAAPISDTITAPIKQSAFAISTDGTSTIASDTLLQLTSSSSYTNSLLVHTVTAGTNANGVSLESGNLSHKTGQLQLDSDVPTQYTSWVADPGYALDTDGPISTNGLFVNGPATITGETDEIALETTGTTPRAMCVFPATGEIVLCPIVYPTVTVTASPTSIAGSGNTTITWSSTNSVSCTGSGGAFNTGNATSGNQLVYQTSTTTYTVVCTASGGQTATNSVTVTSTTPPTVNLTLSPTSNPTPTNANLNWSSSNATTCTGTNFSTGNATNGSLVVFVAATTTYTLTCTNSGGQTASQSVTVSIGAPPPTATLSVVPTYITSTQSVSLTWSSTNAVSCTGTNFSTGNATSGTTSVSQSATKTYTVSCINGAGQTATATKTVPLVPVATLGASTNSLAGDNAIPSITSGTGNVTLTWSSTNAVSCTGSGGSFNTAGATSGSQTVNITTTTTFNLTCTSVGGYTNMTPAMQVVTVYAQAPVVNYCFDIYRKTGASWALMLSCQTPQSTTYGFDWDFGTNTSTAGKRYKVVNPTMTYPGGGTSPTCSVSASGPSAGAVESLATSPFYQYVNNYMTQTPNNSGTTFPFTVPNAIAAFHNCAQGSGCETHDIVKAAASQATYSYSCHYTDMQGNQSLAASLDITFYTP